ncbi:MAG: hypothetical protein D6692_01415 [Planctomycetota bacterium]|nr:MAG: hypothetical protein D6692_01415 [Planctomycetota bacterium]
MTFRRREGFTLIETAFVAAVVGIIAAAMGPALHKARLNARGAVSASNLMQIGQGAGMYAQDNGGKIFSYSWPGWQRNPNGKGFLKVYHKLPDGSTISTISDLEAARAQETEIIWRRLGPDFWDHLDPLYFPGNPARRRIGLVLLDYLDRDPGDELLIDPMDSNQLTWAANPFDYGPGSSVPYANGDPGFGYDYDPSWAGPQLRARWTFSSSYLATVSAWQPDGLSDGIFWVPVASTPHMMTSFMFGNPTDPMRTSELRRFSEVRFPSAKVHFFEEFDREQAGSPYFSYDHARPDKLMFDGSVNAWASGDAMPSWNPRNGKQEWRQTYVPLDTFPVPLGGLGDDTLLSQRYRWTLGGLQGIDYPRPLMGSNRP